MPKHIYKIYIAIMHSGCMDEHSRTCGPAFLSIDLHEKPSDSQRAGYPASDNNVQPIIEITNRNLTECTME